MEYFGFYSLKSQHKNYIQQYKNEERKYHKIFNAKTSQKKKKILFPTKNFFFLSLFQIIRVLLRSKDSMNIHKS